MKYDYTKDVMVVEGKEYSLKPFRKYLVQVCHDIVTAHRVARIWSSGKYRDTYDWQQIYFLASELLITKQYIDEINSQSPGSVSERG